MVIQLSQQRARMTTQDAKAAEPEVEEQAEDIRGAVEVSVKRLLPPQLRQYGDARLIRTVVQLATEQFCSVASSQRH
jgi:hypothetical protein